MDRVPASESMGSISRRFIPKDLKWYHWLPFLELSTIKHANLAGMRIPHDSFANSIAKLWYDILTNVARTSRQPFAKAILSFKVKNHKIADP